MELMVNTNGGELSLLDQLAAEARLYRDSAEMSLYQLARVLTQAKKLVPHGEWGRWLEENADMSVRTAQNMMAAYERFAGKPQFNAIGRAKMFKMLALPEGTEDAFIEEHDVNAMSARAVEQAVKDVRAELEAERRRREAAEKRAIEAEGKPPAVPEELLEKLREQEKTIETHQTELTRVSAIAQEALEQNRALKQEAREREELLEEQQADYNRMQEELLDARSAIAKGDAERQVRDQLTAETFAAAVRQFLGTCFRMPHMNATFAAMTTHEKNEYDELLRSVEQWTRDSRKALEAGMVEGVLIHG